MDLTARIDLEIEIRVVNGFPLDHVTIQERIVHFMDLDYNDAELMESLADLILCKITDYRLLENVG